MLIFSLLLTISYFALVNSVNASIIKKVDPPKPPVQKWNCPVIIGNGKGPTGFGIKSIYRPYYIQISYDTIELFSSSGANCTLNIGGTDLVRRSSFEVYQVSPKVLLLRDELYQSQEVISVNMSTCASFDLSSKVNGKSNVNWNWHSSLIQYEDGFDVILNKNKTKSRVSYDVKGNQIGQPKPFELMVHGSSLFAISPILRTSNLIAEYFMKEKTTWKRYISLVDINGKFIKHLVQLNKARLVLYKQDIGDSLYAFCYQTVSNIIECAQFDETGSEKYRNSTKIADRLIAVSNLKEGGIVIFTDTYKRGHDTKINAIEMRPGRVSRTSYPIAREHGTLFYVTDFDETNRQFTVRAEPVLDKEYQVCNHAFSLRSKHQGSDSSI